MLGWSWLQYQADGAAAETLTQLAELNTKPCRHVATVDCGRRVSRQRGVSTPTAVLINDLRRLLVSFHPRRRIISRIQEIPLQYSRDVVPIAALSRDLFWEFCAFWGSLLEEVSWCKVSGRVFVRFWKPTLTHVQKTRAV